MSRQPMLFYNIENGILKSSRDNLNKDKKGG